MIAKTPKPPYYAVIFTSVKNDVGQDYFTMAELMVKMAQEQEGYLGLESATSEIGITISYWTNLESIKKWKENSDHKIAQELGRKLWYKQYKTRIAKVERDYEL
ncbi:MAG: antibiotic biosynthesis monooxygenase [Bacteroidia bacterium]|jgi:heme-degrading monooxygenase HmoA|nr:antibiotic biosynthesis monooxygenase [Bacteroidia bacterium]